MRVIIAFAVLVLPLSMGGCARSHQAAYAKPITSPLPARARQPSSSLPATKLPEPTKVSSEARSVPEPTKVSSVTPVPVRKPQAPPGAVERGAEDKLKAARAKAEKLGGIHKLTQGDIDGLTSEQLKQLRGY
jgi:cell division septation protein DedD